MDESVKIDEEELADGEYWEIIYYLNTLLDLYGVYFLQLCISTIYAIYLRFTLFNLLIFILKYVPTCVYMYKFMKSIYVTSRDRMKQKQMELEDIQLQIQIINTKISVRDAEFIERETRLKREVARLRRVRNRVRDLIATDDGLRSALHTAIECDSDLDLRLYATPREEDNEFIIEMLKDMKRDHYAVSEPNREKSDYGESGDCDQMTEHSLYSSLSDMDIRQDCNVKIVKVTNVYKVAYLKHFIKQKRLRRASKRAALKKKMDNIKKLLEDWQKTLSMVINNKLTILNIDAHPIDLASQEAMGDYSKPQELSDSDNDLRHDMFHEDALNWTQRYPCGIEEVQDYNQDNGDVAYIPPCRCCKMTSIIEETGSQVAIEVTSEAVDECRDLISL